MNNGISLLKIISGLSKTLNIANQILPIYKQVKPLISNYKNTLNKLPLNQNQKSSPQNNTPEATIIAEQKNPTNKPTFFQ